MKLITLDFETYWSDTYTLSKMTTEAYVRDPQFEAIMVGYKVDDGNTGYAIGAGAIQTVLDSMDIAHSAVLCHHAHFDGLILNHHFHTIPYVWFDTLSMARAIHGIEVGGSLGKLEEYYQVGIVKGTAAFESKGKHLADFGDVTCSDALMYYGRYCCDDVEGTYRVFAKMVENGFPRRELNHIDMLIRMFTEPQLELDTDYLKDYAKTLQAEKLTALIQAGVTKDEVMSNVKFAEALKRLGVTPPEKLSPTTGKPTFAFAKTDKGLLDLEEHPDHKVQALVAARLGNKSTINETRALRMVDMASRGKACLYYKYAGAQQTMRVSGGDKMNWQNLERVLWNDDETVLLKGQLRMSIYAPEGYVLVVPDSSNIEARVLDYLAGQKNMIEAYRKYDRGEGPDIYCVVASGLYGHQIDKSMKLERMLGKVVKLACGYMMGADKFQYTARVWSGGLLNLSISESNKGVTGYRVTHPMVVQFWNRAQSALPELAGGPEDPTHTIDMHGLLRVEKNAIVLPNGLRIKYPQMSYDKDAGWSFAGAKNEGRVYLYGGKIVEHVVQALAKIVVMDQILAVKEEWYNRYGGASVAKMTTHDEGVFVVPEDKGEEMLELALEKFRTPPLWLPHLPVNGAGAIAIRYGEAK
jgi:hypothetical protein